MDSLLGENLWGRFPERNSYIPQTSAPRHLAGGMVFVTLSYYGVPLTGPVAAQTIREAGSVLKSWSIRLSCCRFYGTAKHVAPDSG